MAGDSRRLERLHALDGLRGLGTLFIAYYHFSISDHLHAFNLRILAEPCLDFFFVLSGFIIAHRYADVVTDWPSAAEFTQRRFARLWPMHVAVIAFVLVLRALGVFSAIDIPRLGPVGFSAPLAVAVIGNVLLLNGFMALNLNGPSWTVSVEFYTYLVCAVLCLAAVKYRKPHLRAGLALSVALLSAATLVRLSPFGMGEAWRFAILRCMYCFFAGFVGWHVWRQGWLRLSGTFAEISVVLAAAFLIVLTAFAPGLRYLDPWMFAILLSIFAHERGWLSRLLNTRPAKCVGRWSLSIYLTHVTIGALFYTAMSIWAAGFAFAGLEIARRSTAFVAIDPAVGDVISLLYLLSVVAVSALTFRMIETPGQRFFGPRTQVSRLKQPQQPLVARFSEE